MKNIYDMNLNHKIRGYQGETSIVFEKVKILDVDSLTTSSRIKISDNTELKIIESRHSDCGNVWFEEIKDNVLVNHSNSFVVTKESYDKLINSHRNNLNNGKLQIFTDDNDIYYYNDNIKIITAVSPINSVKDRN